MVIFAEPYFIENFDPIIFDGGSFEYFAGKNTLTAGGEQLNRKS